MSNGVPPYPSINVLELDVVVWAVVAMENVGVRITHVAIIRVRIFVRVRFCMGTCLLCPNYKHLLMLRFRDICIYWVSCTKISCRT